jgi:hypothetical protein
VQKKDCSDGIGVSELSVKAGELGRAAYSDGVFFLRGVSFEGVKSPGSRLPASVSVGNTSGYALGVTVGSILQHQAAQL